MSSVGEGLRGAISELAEEADKGLIPAVVTMSERIGEQTGYVEAAYQAGRTWRDTLGEAKDSLSAMVGPAGDVVGAVGSMAAGVGTMLIAFPGLLTGLTLANIKTLALSVSTKGLAAAAWLLHSPLLPIAVAIGAVFAAWKIGQNEGVQKMLSGWVLGLQEFLGVARKAKEEILEIQNAIDAAINESRDENIRREIAFHSKQIELLKGTGDVRLELSRERIGQLQAELAGLGKVEPKIAAVSVATKQLTDATKELTQAQKELQHEIPITFAAFDLIADAVPGVAIQMGETFEDLLLVLPGISEEIGTKSAETWSTSFFNTISRAFEGGGGFMGGLQSVMIQGWGKLFVGEGETAATGFMGKMQSVMGKLGGVPLVGPLLAAFGPALIKGLGKLASKVWGAIKGLFGGPSGLETEGRAAAAAARDAIAATLTDGQVAEAAGDMGASVHIAVRDAMLGAGASIAEAEAEATRFVEALRRAEAEGPEAVAAVTAEIMKLVEASQKAADLMDDMITTVASIYEQAQEAGVSAYDEVYDASMRSGMGQEEAAAAAADAQKAASAAVLDVEKQKYMRIAAFEAALKAIRSGNAAGAVEAARKAAKETGEAWDAAVGVVGEAWDATAEAIDESSGELADNIKQDLDEMDRVLGEPSPTGRLLLLSTYSPLAVTVRPSPSIVRAAGLLGPASLTSWARRGRRCSCRVRAGASSRTAVALRTSR